LVHTHAPAARWRHVSTVTLQAPIDDASASASAPVSAPALPPAALRAATWLAGGGVLAALLPPSVASEARLCRPAPGGDGTLHIGGSLFTLRAFSLRDGRHVGDADAGVSPLMRCLLQPPPCAGSAGGAGITAGVAAAVTAAATAHFGSPTGALSPSSEAVRLASFSRWPHATHGAATPAALAAAGFSHAPEVGAPDRCVCFCCTLALVAWLPEDEPWGEHRRHASGCAHVARRASGDVPMAPPRLAAAWAPAAGLLWAVPADCAADGAPPGAPLAAAAWRTRAVAAPDAVAAAAADASASDGGVSDLSAAAAALLAAVDARAAPHLAGGDAAEAIAVALCADGATAAAAASAAAANAPLLLPVPPEAAAALAASHNHVQPPQSPPRGASSDAAPFGVLADEASLCALAALLEYALDAPPPVHSGTHAGEPLRVALRAAAAHLAAASARGAAPTALGLAAPADEDGDADALSSATAAVATPLARRLRRALLRASGGEHGACAADEAVRALCIGIEALYPSGEEQASLLAACLGLGGGGAAAAADAPAGVPPAAAAALLRRLARAPAALAAALAPAGAAAPLAAALLARLHARGCDALARLSFRAPPSGLAAPPLDPATDAAAADAAVALLRAAAAHAAAAAATGAADASAPRALLAAAASLAEDAAAAYGAGAPPRGVAAALRASLLTSLLPDAIAAPAAMPARGGHASAAAAAVAADAARELLPALLSALSALARLPPALLAAAAADSAPAPKDTPPPLPLLRASRRVVLESAHPRDATADWARTVCVPGAAALAVSFDPRCSLERGAASVRVFAGGDALAPRGAPVGGPYTSAWPAAPLRVPGDSATLHFTCEGGGGAREWGFRAVVTGLLPTPSRTPAWTDALQLLLARAAGRAAASLAAPDAGAGAGAATERHAALRPLLRLLRAAPPAAPPGDGAAAAVLLLWALSQPPAAAGGGCSGDGMAAALRAAARAPAALPSHASLAAVEGAAVAASLHVAGLAPAAAAFASAAAAAASESSDASLSFSPPPQPSPALCAALRCAFAAGAALRTRVALRRQELAAAAADTASSSSSSSSSPITALIDDICAKAAFVCALPPQPPPRRGAANFGAASAAAASAVCALLRAEEVTCVALRAAAAAAERRAAGRAEALDAVTAALDALHEAAPGAAPAAAGAALRPLCAALRAGASGGLRLAPAGAAARVAVAHRSALAAAARLMRDAAAMPAAGGERDDDAAETLLAALEFLSLPRCDDSSCADGSCADEDAAGAAGDAGDECDERRTEHDAALLEEGVVAGAHTLLTWRLAGGGGGGAAARVRSAAAALLRLLAARGARRHGGGGGALAAAVAAAATEALSAATAAYCRRAAAASPAQPAAPCASWQEEETVLLDLVSLLRDAAADVAAPADADADADADAEPSEATAALPSLLALARAAPPRVARPALRLLALLLTRLPPTAAAHVRVARSAAALAAHGASGASDADSEPLLHALLRFAGVAACAAALSDARLASHALLLPRQNSAASLDNNDEDDVLGAAPAPCRHAGAPAVASAAAEGAAALRALLAASPAWREAVVAAAAGAAAAAASSSYDDSLDAAGAAQRFIAPMALVAAATCAAPAAPSDVPIGVEVRLGDTRAVVVARAPAGDGTVCVALLRGGSGGGDGADDDAKDAAAQQRGVSSLREVHASRLTLAPPRAATLAAAAAAAAPAAAALASAASARAALRAAAFRALSSPAAARAALAALSSGGTTPTPFERALAAAALQPLPRDALWSGEQLSARLTRVRLARLDAALEDAGFGGGAFAPAQADAPAAARISDTPPASPSSPPPSPPPRSRRISQSSDTARPAERRSTGTAYTRAASSSSSDDDNDHANATEDEDASTPTAAAAALEPAPAQPPRRNLLRLWPRTSDGTGTEAVPRDAAFDAAAAAAGAAADALPWPGGGPGAGALFDSGRSYFAGEHGCVVRRPPPRGGWPALASASLASARRAAPLWLRAGGAGAGALAASTGALARPPQARGRCTLLRVAGGRARVRFDDAERGLSLALWAPATSLGRVTAVDGRSEDASDDVAAPLLGGDVATPWSLGTAADAEATLAARAALAALAAAWPGADGAHADADAVDTRPALPRSRFAALCGGAAAFARLLRLHGADAAPRHELPSEDDGDAARDDDDAPALPTRAPDAASWAPLLSMAVAMVQEERTAACNEPDKANADAADAGPIESALVALALRAFDAAASRRWWPRGAVRLESGDGSSADAAPAVREVHAPGAAALAFRFDRRGRNRRDSGVAVFWDAPCTSPVPLPGVAADAHAPFGVAASRVWVRMPARLPDNTPCPRQGAAHARLTLEVLPLGARPAEGGDCDGDVVFAVDDADADAEADVSSASAPPLGVGTSLTAALLRAGLLRRDAAASAADALARYAAAPDAAPCGKPAALRLLSRLLRDCSSAEEGSADASPPPLLLAPARLAALRALLERTLVAERHAGAPFSAFLKTLTEACIVAATHAQAHAARTTPSEADDSAGASAAAAAAACAGAAAICMAPDARASGAVADVSPDGLHVRGAPAGFASVRADAAATARGAWYYEVSLRATRGMLRVGWAASAPPGAEPASPHGAGASGDAARAADPSATLAASLSLAELIEPEQGVRSQLAAGAPGSGIGDDAHSWGFDGARRRLWRAGGSGRYGAPWREGDVLGVGLRIMPSAGADADADAGADAGTDADADADVVADAAAEAENTDGEAASPTLASPTLASPTLASPAARLLSQQLSYMFGAAALPSAAAPPPALRFALTFWLNGQPLGVAAEGDAPPGGLAPAASLAPGEAAEFNFGGAPFTFGPPDGYTAFIRARVAGGAAGGADADAGAAGAGAAAAAAAAGGWFGRAVATASAAAALAAGALPSRAFCLEAAAAQPVVASTPPMYGPHAARDERAAAAAAARWEEVTLCDFASLSDVRPDAPDDVADAAAAGVAAGWSPAHDTALARAVCAGAAAARVDVSCFVRGGTLASVAAVPDARFPAPQLRARLSLLRHLSSRVAALLPLVDLDGHNGTDDDAGDAAAAPGGLFGTLAALRDVLLPCATAPVWDSALVATAAGEERPSLSLNRARAAAAAAAGTLARGAGAGALFAQAHAALARTPPRALRQAERAWTVLFEGEGTRGLCISTSQHIASAAARPYPVFSCARIH
jgi:hypothetical protein